MNGHGGASYSPPLEILLFPSIALCVGARKIPIPKYELAGYLAEDKTGAMVGCGGMARDLAGWRALKFARHLSQIRGEIIHM
jgi:hypothetical protein